MDPRNLLNRFHRPNLIIQIAIGLALLAGLLLYSTSNPAFLKRASLGLGKVSSGRLGGKDPAFVHKTAERHNEEVCFSCHGDMKTAKTPWHKMHLEKPFIQFTCQTCHKSFATGLKRSLKGKILIDRSVCPRCHRQKFVAFNADHRRPDWIKLHRELRGSKTGGADIPASVEELAEKHRHCFMCHERKELSFCKDCHEFHPHNEQWVNGGHGRLAVKKDFYCLRCHNKNTWCTDQCHDGITLPHNIPKWSKHWKDESDASEWRKTHWKEALRLSAGDPVKPAYYNPAIGVPEFTKCRRCHDSTRSLGRAPDFCMECHHARFYMAFPDFFKGETQWLPAAMRFVKINGADRCWKCHLNEWCETCHTTDKKAPPGTTFVGWDDDGEIGRPWDKLTK